MFENVKKFVMDNKVNVVRGLSVLVGAVTGIVLATLVQTGKTEEEFSEEGYYDEAPADMVVDE